MKQKRFADEQFYKTFITIKPSLACNQPFYKIALWRFFSLRLLEAYGLAGYFGGPIGSLIINILPDGALS
jgi:hypothetical protein